jgi:hypothetical protein
MIGTFTAWYTAISVMRSDDASGPAADVPPVPPAPPPTPPVPPPAPPTPLEPPALEIPHAGLQSSVSPVVQTQSE